MYLLYIRIFKKIQYHSTVITCLFVDWSTFVKEMERKCHNICILWFCIQREWWAEVKSKLYLSKIREGLWEVWRLSSTYSSLNIIWMWMVSFMQQLLYHQEDYYNLWIGGWMGSRTDLNYDVLSWGLNHDHQPIANQFTDSYSVFWNGEV
jgi:hypothetical protein